MSERIVNVHEKWYKDVKYRSTLEANTAEVLDLLGLPIRYEERVITLLDGFRCPFQKDKVRGITYTPDFWLTDKIIIECKGFETPEWKNKKKYIYKYLVDNEPDIMFYQIHDCQKSLLKVLDNYWQLFGYKIQVKSRPKGRNAVEETYIYDAVVGAMEDLKLGGKALGPIVNSLTGKREYVYNYNWKLVKV